MLSAEQYHNEQIERLKLSLQEDFYLLPKECLDCQHADLDKHRKAVLNGEADLLDTSHYCERRMIYDGDKMCAGRLAVCEEMGVKLYTLREAANILNTNAKQVKRLFDKYDLPLTKMKGDQAWHVPDWAVRYLQYILGKV